jgi:UDP-N-acetylmuramate--alanine ligase
MTDQPPFKTAHHIHFTGIKGVGMAAAALCAQDLGIEISGSDTLEDYVTSELLTQRNITPSINFEPQAIPSETDLLIYTGAHQGEKNPQVQAARAKGIRAISHAKAVGELMADKIGISVCGVGGKTSISAMLANIFDFAGLKPSFLIGVGKVLNLQVPGRMSPGAHFIAEADEYVVSPGTDNTPRFMYHTPQAIICTNIIHDHPDVYASIEDTKKAFQAFFHQIPKDGLIILNANSAAAQEINLEGLPITYYGHTPDKADWWVKETYVGDGKQLVIFANKDREFKLSLSVPGEFNAQNALAAYIQSAHFGLKHDTIIQALQLFRGSMRRFEKISERNGILYYDDYAHHPSQILATLKAAKQWLPLSKIVAVFQPHTYSRTKAFLDQFAKSFNYADRVIITDVYASMREAVDESVSGYKLAELTKQFHPNVTFVPQSDLSTYLQANLKPQDALFTLGAGNIYTLHQQLTSL